MTYKTFPKIFKFYKFLINTPKETCFELVQIKNKRVLAVCLKS